MLELLKTLAEEPAKRKKVLIFYIKVVLTSVAASTMYTYFFGNYVILDAGNKDFFTEAINFFIVGKVLKVGIVYVVCYFFLFELIAMIPPLALSYFSRGKSAKMQFDNGIISTFMVFYGVIIRNKATREISTGKHFDEFYYELVDYHQSNTKDEIYKYRHSLLFEIVTTYAIGLFVFYSFTSFDLPKILDWLLLGGLVLLVVSYIYICSLINIIEHNLSELVILLHTLKVEEIVISSLKLFQVPFNHNKKMAGLFFSKTVTIENRERLLVYYGTKIGLGEVHIKDVIKGAYQQNITDIILLTNFSLTKKANVVADKYKSQITILYFTTEEELKEVLAKYFYQ